MFIKKFEDFINEAYLKGGRQPVYHFTSSSGLLGIIKSDELKTSKPARQSHGYDKSISLTRNIDYSDSRNDFCLELDSDSLLRDGYRIYPVDEISWKEGKPNKLAIKNFNFIKSNFLDVKSGKRGTKHGLKLPKNPILETEFEERIYKNVKGVGKYILRIILNRDVLNTRIGFLNEDLRDILVDYLNKYPHVRIYKSDGDFRRSIDITDLVVNKEVIKI
jgi:hypothetical protein